METPKVQEVNGGIIFPVRALPRSSINEIVGSPSGSLKIKLTSPPIDGAANKLCVKSLSKWLNISKSRIQIVSGLKSRHKMIKIIGWNKNDFNLFMKKVSHEGSEK